MVGGGAAVFDCNGDGFEDVLLAGRREARDLLRQRQHAGRRLTFAKQQSGLEFDAMTGAYPIDIDGDGIMDVVVLRVGENIVMRGEGDCHFTRANEAWGFDGGDGWSTAFAATWEKGAAWPTHRHRQLHRPHARSWSPGAPARPTGCTGRRTEAKGFAPPLAAQAQLLPALHAVHRLEQFRHARTCAFATTANITKAGRSRCGASRRASRRSSTPRKTAGAYLRIWGMGIAGYDIDGDGYQEYFLTSMADNKLQTLASPPKDGASAAARLTRTSPGPRV